MQGARLRTLDRDRSVLTDTPEMTPASGGTCGRADLGV